MTGWELKIWRRSMGWSREKAARELGVSLRTWHTWENAAEVGILVERATIAFSIELLLPLLRARSGRDIVKRLNEEFRAVKAGK